jgi:hypothetical protein
MASELMLGDKRRGERVLIRVPVHIKAVAENGSQVAEPAEAVVVSRYGALLRTSTRLKNGTPLALTHGFSKETEQFQVVWAPEKPTDGKWDTGIEAKKPREDFWGIRFPPKDPKA